MKKKEIILMFILLVSIVGVIDVKAADFHGDANTTTGFMNGVDIAYGNFWASSSMQGIRVYIIDKSTNKEVSRVVDYTNQTGLDNYVNNGNLTKLHYRDKSITSITPSSTSYSYQKPVKYLPPVIASGNPTVIYDYFKSIGNDETALKTLLGPGHLNFEGDIENLTKNKYYLVVEPVGYFNYKGLGPVTRSYALTATETAMFLSKADANTAYWINANKYCISCISFFTHQNLPLSIYIKDSHLGFRGMGNPSAKIYNSEDIIGSSGLGIGIFWLDEFVDTTVKPPEPVKPTKCDPVTSSPGECGEVGSYKDSSDWTNCVYKSTRVLNQSFCPVYCREEVNTYFPGDYETAVKAGNHFVWEPIAVSGNKECRTTQINYLNWKSQWDTQNNRIPGLYDAMRREEIKEDLMDIAYGVGKPSKQCDCEINLLGVDCCVRTEKVPKSITYCDGNEDENGKCLGKTVTYRWEEEECAGWDRNESNRYTYYPSRNRQYSNSNRRSETVVSKSWCSDEDRPRTNIDSTTRSYTNAVETRENLEKAMNRCYSWMSDIKYNLAPNISLNFSYNGGNYNFALGYKPNEYDTTRYCGLNNKNCNYSQSGNGSTRLVKNVCTSDGCPGRDNYTLYHNSYIHHNIYKDLNYTLPSNTFRYVQKSTGLSTSSRPPSNYVDIGYGNLPVHYTTLTGTKPISLTYSNLGEKGKFDIYLKPDFITGKRGLYRCVYNVIQGLTPGEDPEPKTHNPGPENEYDGCINPGCGSNKSSEIRVIYRPISLASPFAAVDGRGRNPGQNWSSGNLVKQYILNNRGVSGDKIYTDREPMYEIELNPVRIKAIRDYNRTTNYDDFNLSCKTGTGTECKSKFIRETFNAYFTTGINGRSTTRCGISNNWTACDTADGIKR